MKGPAHDAEDPTDGDLAIGWRCAVGAAGLPLLSRYAAGTVAGLPGAALRRAQHGTERRANGLGGTRESLRAA